MIGFLDESTKEVYENTARVWSMGKPICTSNYSVSSVKVSGFYALNGESVITRIPDTTSPSICKMLTEVRDANGNRPIIMVLDNASNHHSRMVTEKAKELNITLAFLPPYTPRLNPIEQVWKCIKREVSVNFIVDLDELFWLIKQIFLEKVKTEDYADKWKKKFPLTPAFTCD